MKRGNIQSKLHHLKELVKQSSLADRSLSESMFEIIGEIEANLPKETAQSENIIGELSLKLKNAEDNFSKIFHTSFLMISISTIDTGEYLAVNDYFCSSSEYSRDEVIGNTSVDLGFIRAEDRAKLKAAIKKDGFVKNMEILLSSKTKKDIACLYNGEVIYVQGKAVLLSVAQDITGIKQNEEKLLEAMQDAAESEERFRKLSELTFEGIVLHKEGICVDCNKSIENITGYLRDDLIGQNLIMMVVAEESREKVKEQIQKNYAKPYEIISIRKDGTKFTAEIEARNITWKNEIIRVAAIRNVSERVEARGALEASERKYRELLENSPIGIVQTSSTGKTLLCNTKMAEIVGFENKEEGIKHFSDLAHQLYADPKRRDEFVTVLMKEGSVENFEYEAVLRDGTHKWLSMNAKVSKKSDDDDFVIDAFVTDVTERIVMEQEIRASEEKFRQVWESANEGMRLSDENGYIIEVNDAFCRLVKLNRDELIGKPLSVIQKENHKSIVAKHKERFRNRTIPSHFEKELILHNGEHIWFELFHSFIDVPGEPTKSLAIFHDITERKRTEDALEKRLLALTSPLDENIGLEFDEIFNLSDIQKIQDDFAEATGVASIITRPDGTPITAPSNFRHLCNNIIRKTDKGLANCIKSDAIIGKYNPDGPTIQPCMSCGLWDAGTGIVIGDKHIASWLIGQVRDESQNDEAMKKYAIQIGADADEFIKAFHEVPEMSLDRFESITKALFTIATQISNIAYQNVQQARFIAERKKAEKDLVKSEHKYRSIIESSPDGFAQFSMDGRVLEVNDAYCKMMGYTKEELLSIRIKDVIYKFSEKEIKSHITQLISEGKFHTESIHKRKDGSLVDVEITAGSLELFDDRFFAFIRDISERKKSEKELLETKQKAEEASKLKTNLLLSMSHEIRTPINGILGLSDILQDMLDNEYHKELVSKVHLSTKRLLLTLTSVINFAQLSAQHEIRKFEKIPLTEYLDTILLEFIPLIEAKGLKYKMQMDDEKCYVRATEESLYQIISNLLDNAIKFTEKGQITVSLKQGKSYCKLQVTDTGIGMEEQYHSVIFEEFRQISEGYDRSYEGTGLGLAIVRKNVDLLSAKLEVRSELHAGSTFIIKFPRNPESFKANSRDEQDKIQTNTNIKSTTSLPRILIVEDNEINIEIIRLQLKNMYDFSYTYRGEDAVAMVKKEKFDLILMDINLGIGIDGIETAKGIWKTEGNEELPIIAVTGYVYAKDKERILNCGFSGYLPKPFTKEDLQKEIEKVLNK